MMIFILNILINLIFIYSIRACVKGLQVAESNDKFFAEGVNKQSQQLMVEMNKLTTSYNMALASVKRAAEQIQGRYDQLIIKSSIAEKMADRAFTIASSNTIATIALQKTLPIPKPLTKEQITRNTLARKEIDRIYNLSNEGEMEYYRPLMSDEENAIYDKLMEEKTKVNNGDA